MGIISEALKELHEINENIEKDNIGKGVISNKYCKNYPAGKKGIITDLNIGYGSYNTDAKYEVEFEDGGKDWLYCFEVDFTDNSELDEAYWGLYALNRDIDNESLIKIINDHMWKYNILDFDRRLVSDKKYNQILDILNLNEDEYITSIYADEEVSADNDVITIPCEIVILRRGQSDNFDEGTHKYREIKIKKDILLDLIDKQLSSKVDITKPKRGIQRALCKAIINGLCASNPTDRRAFFEE